MVFALPHLVNHLAGLPGGDAHVAIMSVLRLAYRRRAVEAVLLAAVAFQVGSGVWLLHRRGTTGSTLQAASGAYLLVFLLSHVSAALRTRARGGDPDWHWLAGNELLHDPWSCLLYTSPSPRD